MRKTIANCFKCMKNIVRTIVVRVLRGFEHNPDYDLGNPRAASAGTHRQNIVRHHRTLPDTIENSIARDRDMLGRTQPRDVRPIHGEGDVEKSFAPVEAFLASE